MWRFVVVQTAISIAINIAIGAAPTAIARLGGTAFPAPTLHDVVTGLTPQIMAGSLMSALVPALLARRRPDLARLPTIFETASVALAVGVSFAAIGMIVLGLPMATGGILGPGTALLLKMACGGLLGLLVTPVALLATIRVAYSPDRTSRQAAASLPKTSDNAANNRSICPSVPTVIRR